MAERKPAAGFRPFDIWMRSTALSFVVGVIAYLVSYLLGAALLPALLFVLMALSFMALTGVPDITCDDGTKLFDDNGEINFRCRIDGYTLYDDISWPERTAMCYDDDDQWDDLACGPMESTTCASTFSCAVLWATCSGTFVCAQGAKKPCNWGVCEEASSPQAQ